MSLLFRLSFNSAIGNALTRLADKEDSPHMNNNIDRNASVNMSGSFINVTWDIYIGKHHIKILT